MVKRRSSFGRCWGSVRRWSPRPSHAAAWTLILWTSMAGCQPGPELAPATGRVTFDGKPLKFGTVMFQHVNGGQPARGEIQPDGSFVLSTFHPEDGALIGQHRVRITCYSTQDPANRNAGPTGDSLGRLLTPQKYASLGTSGLRVEVKPGQNEPFAFELAAPQGGRR